MKSKLRYSEGSLYPDNIKFFSNKATLVASVRQCSLLPLLLRQYSAAAGKIKNVVFEDLNCCVYTLLLGVGSPGFKRPGFKK